MAEDMEKKTYKEELWQAWKNLGQTTHAGASPTPSDKRTSPEAIQVSL
jgi:hypothetical protein